MTSSASRRHFEQVAGRYDELRPTDESWWRVFDAIVELGDLRGRRVLEVGAGTARLSAALAERAYAKVWATDASAAMVEQAKAAGVNARVASAESLPFKQGWFERAVARMSVHLFDRPRAFAQLHRVLASGGCAVVATVDPERFGKGWYDAYFPSAAAVDRARFPSAEVLEDELRAAGFAVRVERLELGRTLTRERALDSVRGRAFSTFSLLPDEEYERGLARAEAELPETVEFLQRWLLVRADRP
jgi:ubiquinone/menaquinone biosynthesis C-methylase UbiE